MLFTKQNQAPNENTFSFHFIINTFKSTSGLGKIAQWIKHLLSKGKEQFPSPQPM